MVQRAAIRLVGEGPLPVGAVFRYDMLDRLERVTRDHEVQLLAFGFTRDELRLVLDGDRRAVTEALRGLKVGTIRAAIRWGMRLRTGDANVSDVEDVLDAAVWAHRGPLDAGASHPLGSPWSSHRDLFGFRRSGFYDRRALVRRVDPAAIHDALGGDLPRWKRPPPLPPPDLSFHLRVAAAVRGVLPADRRCFRLFTHLATRRGYQSGEIADALHLTTRRIRQLKGELEPDVETALTVLEHPVLSKVP
jgi:hypothetical protein